MSPARSHAGTATRAPDSASAIARPCLATSRITCRSPGDSTDGRVSVRTMMRDCRGASSSSVRRALSMRAWRTSRPAAPGIAIMYWRRRTYAASGQPASEAEIPQRRRASSGSGSSERRAAASKLTRACSKRPASNSLPARARYAWRSRPPASGTSARPGPAAARISAAASSDATGRAPSLTPSFWHGRAIHRTNARRGAEARATLSSPPRPCRCPRGRSAARPGRGGEAGALAAVGNSIPLMCDGTRSDLPRDIPEILQRGVAVRRDDRRPTALSALAAIVDPDHRARGLSRQIIEAMRDIARRHSLGTLVAPVRPTVKALYPLTPMERYVTWKRANGSAFDPWIAVHESMGAEILDVSPTALVITDTVQRWQEWTGMIFPESGRYVVTGAFQPVTIDLRRNVGRYEEANVWMKHPLAPTPPHP